MKAIIKTETGKGNICYMDVAEPNPQPNEVKIRVDSAGICGTDIKIYHNEAWSNPPVILGHEYSGTVEAVGDSVIKVKTGDRVISETAQVICGKCSYCNTSNQLMCPERLSIGYGTNGAFAEYCVVREDIVHLLPDTVSFEEGALCEPAAVAVHAVYDRVVLKPTDLVVVMGPGPIGLLIAQLVKGFGCTTVLTGVDNDQDRLKLGEKLGIDIIINVNQQDLTTDVMKLTDGLGADIIFDCTGAIRAIRDGMNCIKKKGKFVQVGLTKQFLEIEYALLAQKEISLIGTFGHNWSNWEDAIKLIAYKKLNVKDLITHRFSLEDWEKAFSVSESQQGIKVLLHPVLK